MRLSAVFIVKNEEELLAQAMESVKEFDEIIVIDTGSTDRTKEIASQYTDKIFDFPWCDDFSAARNEAIKHATGDWIYSIDADQRLLSPVSLVRSEAERAEAGGHKTVLVKTMTDGKHVHYREVFFKKDPEVFWKGAVHEGISIPSTFKSEIERYRGASNSKKADPDRNLRILQKSPKTPRNVFYLGREYYERKMYHEAIGWLLQYEGTWAPERAEAYLCLAYSYWFTERGDKAREFCLAAIKVNPMFKEALLLMGTMHNEPYKQKWTKLASVATNEDVLFVRT